MIPLDAQQQRLLERLRKAGDQPVAFGELHAGGIDFPAAVVPELELNGYVIERVYDHGRLVGVRLLGVRLLHLDPPDMTDTSAAQRRGGRPRPHRWPTAVHPAITANGPCCESRAFGAVCVRGAAPTRRRNEP